jgi:hypothetical protein
MSDFIWYWNKGNTKIFTKNTDVAEKALKDGKLVMARRIRSGIRRF